MCGMHDVSIKELSDMLSNTSFQNVGVPSHTMKMSLLLALTLVRGSFTTEQVEDINIYLCCRNSDILCGAFV